MTLTTSNERPIWWLKLSKDLLIGEHSACPLRHSTHTERGSEPWVVTTWSWEQGLGVAHTSIPVGCVMGEGD